MKKVFLEDLPKKEGIGALKGKQVIDWVRSVGSKVRFIYDDVDSCLNIIAYNPRRGVITIEYNNIVRDIRAGSFTKCRFGNLLNKITDKFKVEVGQSFKDFKRDFTITYREHREYENKPDKKGRIYTINQKWYKYTCNKCGWTEGWIIEGHLLEGNGCGCCSNQTAVTGINTLWDTDRRLVSSLGIDEQEAKNVTYNSGKKIKCVCPYCGNIMYKICSNVYKTKSIGCICGDGFSYPEKFMYSVLKQLNVEFETQYSPEWVGNKKYDFYIPSLNMIIETHGIQHYKEALGVFNSLNQQQLNDCYKEEIAIINGIENYIVLSCSESNLKYIKNSILNSELNNLFNLYKIDWLQCEEFTTGNIIKEVCDYWNNKEEWETTKNLAKIFNIGKTSVLRYLNKGTKLGWCCYDGKMEKSIVSSRNGKSLGKKVRVFKDGEFLMTFNSCAELSRQSEELFGIKLFTSNIASVCLGKHKQYKGYVFKYEEIAEM